MDMKPLKRIPNVQQLTDAEVCQKLNELIDNSNAQLDEIVYLRGQVNLLAAQVTALRRR
jgi:polyhydroxyalkanoate synthesis regulator phasin